jgi:RHH-type proline utilization regulon transcriptional repressor/proline dehydrogenase/delta 1-pyrroline-5-carboxylate dehydrogenase
MLTGRIVRLDPNDVAAPESVMGRIVGRVGEPVVRTAMRQAMRIMGHQFVMGRTMKEALDNSLSGANKRYRYTFDMLGEAALTTADATRYFDAYRTAIGALAARVNEYPDFESRPSISVKLSAMHPRFERAHRQRVHRELTPRLVELCRLAREAGIALTLDTEESERLELTMEQLEAVCREPLRAADAAVHRRTRARHQPHPARATGQGRVLGRRNQARAGARAAWIPALYP